LFFIMLCVSVINDIFSWAEAEFELDAHFLSFFLDDLHSSILVLSCPFLNAPAAAACALAMWRRPRYNPMWVEADRYNQVLPVTTLLPMFPIRHPILPVQSSVSVAAGHI
jgi:hypothetical protein